MAEVLGWQDLALMKILVKEKIRDLRKGLDMIATQTLLDKNEANIARERIKGQLLAYEPLKAKLDKVETPMKIGDF